jgi:hypothetical protein
MTVIWFESVELDNFRPRWAARSPRRYFALSALLTSRDVMSTIWIMRL